MLKTLAEVFFEFAEVTYINILCEIAGWNSQLHIFKQIPGHGLQGCSSCSIVMSCYIILLQAFPTANLPRYLWKLVWHLRGVNSSQFQKTCSTELSRFLQVLAYWILLAFLFKQQIRLVSIYLWPQCSYGSSVFFPFSLNVFSSCPMFSTYFGWLVSA